MEILENHEALLCSSMVGWEVFVGFAMFQHRRNDRNTILDQFGGKPTPIKFCQHFKLPILIIGEVGNLEIDSNV